MTTPPYRVRYNQSIAFRLGASMILILMIVVTGTIFAATSYGKAAADETFDRLLRGAAMQIAERVRVTDGEPAVDLPISAFEMLSLARSDKVFYKIIGPDDKTLTGYEDLFVPEDEDGNGDDIFNSTYKGVDVRIVRLARQLAERSVSGEVVIAVAQTTEERSALARSITTQAVLIIAVAGITLLMLSIFFLRIALRPLARLEEAILRRDANDLSPIDMPAPKEVAGLVASINRFMLRLDRRVEEMQNFVADAAHQIRTPITALRAQAQLALEESDPNRLAKLHKRLYSRSVGLGRLADQLLSRALVTHRSDTAPLQIVDLRRVAMEADREMRAMCGYTVNLVLPEEAVTARGDPITLAEAIKNLLNNALCHGRPPVSLIVTSLPNGCTEIFVRDGGQGIPKALAGRIGERFTSDGIKPESAGLGLSIVAAVAVSHQAALIQRTTPDGAFEIGLILGALP